MKRIFILAALLVAGNATADDPGVALPAQTQVSDVAQSQDAGLAEEHNQAFIRIFESRKTEPCQVTASTHEGFAGLNANNWIGISSLVGTMGGSNPWAKVSLFVNGQEVHVEKYAYWDFHQVPAPEQLLSSIMDGSSTEFVSPFSQTGATYAVLKAQWMKILLDNGCMP